MGLLSTPRSPPRAHKKFFVYCSSLSLGLSTNVRQRCPNEQLMHGAFRAVQFNAIHGMSS